MMIVGDTYVQIIPVKSEWILNFLARNQETSEDKCHNRHSRDGNPIECCDQLEWQGPAIYERHSPKVDAIALPSTISSH